MNNGGTTAQLDGTLTQGSSHTIEGQGNMNAVLTNNGTVNADVSSGVLNLNGGVTNNSLMEDTNGGELSINSSTVTQTATGQIVANGGGTLGFVLLSGATISGGTLNSATGGFFSTAGTNTIGSLTNSALIDVQNNTVLNITGNLTDNGTITVNSGQGGNQTQLIVAGGTISGTGAIVLNNGGNTARLDGTLTQALGHTVAGQGNINAALTNNGIVDANVSGATLVLQTSSMTNNKVFEATAGGTLQINAITIAQGASGVISAGNASTVNVINGATVSSGSVASVGSGAFNVVDGTFTNVTITAASTVNVPTSDTLGFTSLTNNGTLSVTGTATGGALSGTGALTIASSGAVHLSHNTGLSQQSGLTITSGGKLDIGNNHMILSYDATDPVNTIYGYLQSGYSGGTWNGIGINSSTANLPANNANYGVGFVDGKDGVSGADSAPGVPLTSGQILIAYALYGDVNLDGLVNATDFAIFGANFNTAVTGWERGDFTYSGLVNATDFALLGSNFGKSAVGTAVALPASDYTALDAFASANGLALPSVPEPASVSLIVVASAGMLSRRRRRTDR